MEIHGSSFLPAPYPAPELARKDPQYPAGGDEQIRPTRPAPIPQPVKTGQSGVEPQRKRYYSLENDLTHPARQAINSYHDTDFAAGPELMNRVDVYA